MSSIDVAGMLSVATGNRLAQLPLSTSIGDLQVKTIPFTIAAGGAYVSFPLTLPAGVTEALYVAIFSNKTLRVRVTSADATNPGPCALGIRGHWSMVLAPGEGITALSMSNPDTGEDANVEVVIGCKVDNGDDPDFWTIDIDP